jgi:hypothetical protein
MPCEELVDPYSRAVADENECACTAELAGLVAWLQTLTQTSHAMMMFFTTFSCMVQSMDAEEADKLRQQQLAQVSSNGLNGFNGSSNGGSSPLASGESSNGNSSSNNGVSSSSKGHKGRDFMLNLDLWKDQGFPTAVSVCVVACCKGVKRAHLVDARVDGGMLLELYSRDGIGTMISTDFYEGIRRARSADLEAIQVMRGLGQRGSGSRLDHGVGRRACDSQSRSTGRKWQQVLKVCDRHVQGSHFKQGSQFSIWLPVATI